MSLSRSTLSFAILTALYANPVPALAEYYCVGTTTPPNTPLQALPAGCALLNTAVLSTPSTAFHAQAAGTICVGDPAICNDPDPEPPPSYGYSSNCLCGTQPLDLSGGDSDLMPDTEQVFVVPTTESSPPPPVRAAGVTLTSESFPYSVLLTASPYESLQFETPEALAPPTGTSRIQWQLGSDSLFATGSLLLDRTLKTGGLPDTLDLPDYLLEPWQRYWLRYRLMGPTDALTEWSVPAEIITFLSGDPASDAYLDGDANGIVDLYQLSEDADTNGDGVNDLLESGAVVDAPAGQGAIGLFVDQGTLDGLSVVQVADLPGNAPANQDLPYGALQFHIDGLPVNAINPATVNVSIYFPASLPENARWLKLDPVTGKFEDYSDHVDFFGNHVVIHLVDGGDGDADGLVNGVIIDPGMVAIPTAAPTPPTTSGTSTGGGGGGGGGFSIGELMLLWAALRGVRRKRG